MKNKESELMEYLYASAFLVMIIAVILNLLFKINFILLGGIAAIFLGLIQFYLKDKVWYLFWILVPLKPIYVKLIGGFLIFIGLLFVLLGVI